MLATAGVKFANTVRTLDAILNCVGDVAPDVRRAIEQLIDDGIIASAVYREVTESTNSDALAELQAGGVDDQLLPRLYLTDRQTAGRGRQGNSWISPADAITLSLVVQMDASHPSAAALSPAVGVAVARAIEYRCAPCRVALKWPNDLCAHWMAPGRSSSELYKLGGILIETAASVVRRTVIGIGLNLGGSPELSSPGHLSPASLAQVTSRSVCRESLLAALAESLFEMLNELVDDPAGLIDQYRQRCVLTGKDLSLSRHGEIVTGYCTGITDDGSLELFVDGRRIQFRSGEVHRVRSV